MKHLGDPRLFNCLVGDRSIGEGGLRPIVLRVCRPIYSATAWRSSFVGEAEEGTHSGTHSGRTIRNWGLVVHITRGALRQTTGGDKRLKLYIK